MMSQTPLGQIYLNDGAFEIFPSNLLNLLMISWLTEAAQPSRSKWIRNLNSAASAIFLG
jgi:hypothetical protein